MLKIIFPPWFQDYSEKNVRTRQKNQPTNQPKTQINKHKRKSKGERKKTENVKSYINVFIQCYR